MRTNREARERRAGETSSILAVFSLLALFPVNYALAGGPPDSWSSAASMNVARQGHAVAMAGANVIVIGGCATTVSNGCQTGDLGATYLNSVEQYTAGSKDSWTFLKPMSSSRAGHAATTLPNGKILVTGGIGLDSSSTAPGVLASAELYSPADNTWSAAGATGQMTSARAGHTATLLGASGQVLIVGGITDLSGTVSTTAEIYDSATNTFTDTRALVPAVLGRNTPFFARAYHTGLLLNSGAVLLAGGQGSSGTLNTIERFDLVNGFISVGAMLFHRAFHTATLAGGLGNDIAVFIGGNDGNTDLATAETWDGSVASLAGTMGVGRESHTATQFPSGKVLVTGGLSGGASQPSCEVWDWSTLAFTTSKGSLSDARASHVAVYIPSIDRVLVAGGQGGTASAPATLSSAELYRPKPH